MIETALSVGNGYHEFIREAFIDPIRAVTSSMTNFAEKLHSERLDVKIEDCKRVKGILGQPRNWLVDVHDGGGQDGEIETAGHLSQTDLLTLDYQLVKGDQSGDKAIEILRKLAANDHFNLVVYTRRPPLIKASWRRLSGKLQSD